METNTLDTSMDEELRFTDIAPLSDDWYHGHKVVTMPSSAFGGKCVREVVTSKNETSSNNKNKDLRHHRSNSLGRAPVRPGQDIIQDVYDRIGVSYNRGMDYGNGNDNNFGGEAANPAPSMQVQTQPPFPPSDSNTGIGNWGSSRRLSEKFSGRYRTAAAVARTAPTANVSASQRGRNSDGTAGTNSSPRGRAREGELEESEGQRRARSLSRGRTVKGVWPPVPSVQQSAAQALPAAAPKSMNNLAESSIEARASPKRSHSFDARPQYGRGSLRSVNNKISVINPSPDAVQKEEKKECDERSALSYTAAEKEEQSGPSIKDRMKVFAGNKSKPSSSRSIAKSYMKSAPPKVDIYEGARTESSDYHEHDPTPENEEQTMDEMYQNLPKDDPDLSPPSAAAVAAAEEAYRYLRPSQMASKNKTTSTRHSTESRIKSNARSTPVAISYLSGSQAPGGGQNSRVSNAVSAVPANSGEHLDSNSSVGTSSCGENDSKLNRKSSWGRNYNSNQQNNITNAIRRNSDNDTVTVSAETLERMVDERIQTQLREVEARMEALLRQWMDQMNSKITSRLDAMETSIRDSMPDPSWREEI